MIIKDKTLTFDHTLWVQFDGVAVQEKAGQVILTAKEEDAYLKVFNHFGRVLKLYTFEDNQWIDVATGMAAGPFNDEQAGRLPEGAKIPTQKKAGTKKADAKTASKKAEPKKTASKKVEPKKAATEKPQPKKAEKAAGGKSAASKGKDSKGKSAKKTAGKSK